MAEFVIVSGLFQVCVSGLCFSLFWFKVYS